MALGFWSLFLLSGLETVPLDLGEKQYHGTLVRKVPSCLFPQNSWKPSAGTRRPLYSQKVIINKSVSLKNVMAQDLCSFLVDKLF